MDNATTANANRPPHRTSRSLLTRMTTPLLSLRGGPKFDDCIRRHADCGNFAIDLFEPRAEFGSGAEPVAFDPSNDATFNRIAYVRRSRHPCAKIAITNWSYYRPYMDLSRYLPIPHEPYVTVTAIWQLERVKQGLSLEVGNDDMLEDYLRNDYEAFLESEGGFNWKERKSLEEEFGEWDSPEQMQQRLVTNLKRPPANYERLRFNDLSWLRYAWKPYRRVCPEALMYSRTVASRTLLTLILGAARLDGTERSDARWWKRLLEDSEDLMTGVTITDKSLPPA